MEGARFGAGPLTIDRDGAAALLGVGPGASHAEIRTAFRRRAQAAHPDAGRVGAARAGSDMAALRQARDLLLGAPALAPDPELASPPVASKAGSVSPRPPRPVGPRRRPRSMGWIWRLALVAVGLIMASAIGLLVVAAVVGEDPVVPAGPAGFGPEAGECLVVLADRVEAAACDAPRAQRVVSSFDGPGTCPAGTDQLGAGSTSWCLQGHG